MRHTGIYVAYHDRSLTKVWTRNILAPLVPKKKGGGLPPAQLERIEAAQRHVLETGESGRIEVSMPHEDGVRWFDIWLDADLDDDGAIQGIVSTWIEVTEQKRREQTLKTLLREVSHRSKNLLAIIQGIASQTGRYSSDIGDFLTRFRGRLQSLSSSQDLVTSSNWRGAQLRELIEGQMERYGADPSRSLRFEGVDPFLNPNAALHIGLAVHELVVNSMSYGALSQSDAVVDVTAGLRISMQIRRRYGCAGMNVSRPATAPSRSVSVPWHSSGWFPPRSMAWPHSKSRTIGSSTTWWCRPATSPRTDQAPALTRYSP